MSLNVKHIIALIAVNLLYAGSSVFSKFASQQEFLSLNYCLGIAGAIGVSGVSERVGAFASAAAEMGAMRFPLIGRMLNFEMPWDGIILIDRLVKWNTLAGPMC